MNRALTILAITALVAAALLNLPIQKSVAQPDWGPNVASELKRFDEVYKTASTHTIITGASGKKIRIISLFVRSLSSTAVNVYFKEQDGSSTMFGTNATDTEALDAISISGKAGWMANVNEGGWAETSTAGKGVQMVLDGAQPVSVVGTYVEIY